MEEVGSQIVPDAKASSAYMRIKLSLMLSKFSARDHASGGAPIRASKDLDAGPRSRLRMIYDDIGRFLFTHQLDITPLNFSCAQDYLEGGDRQLVSDLDLAVRERRVSDAWIEEYVASKQGQFTTPTAISEMADQVEQELNRSLGVLENSAANAATFGNALSLEQNSNATTQQILDLTHKMVAQMRLAETELRESHSQVRQLRTTLRAARRASEIDSLTDLPNRRGFERRAKELRAANTGQSLVIAICDIDNFKLVNDRFGHATGDRVLQFIANDLRKLSRKGYLVARLGGEEFVMLVAGKNVEHAADELNRVRSELGARNLVDSNTGTSIGAISFSAGISAINPDVGIKQALREADAALYAAKRTGRNRIYIAHGDGDLAPTF